MNIFVNGMRQMIEWIYGFSGDYGVAIVLMTIAIRALMLPLNAKQRKQMQKQQVISEKAEKLKEKYKKNPQKLNDELQKLYQNEGTGMGGCLLSFLQLPIMMCLYQGIRMTVAAGTVTVLLPWVSSLLWRDSTLILPIATLIVQILPQTYPYLRFFKALNLPKTSPVMVGAMLLSNALFVFVIPSGVGLYYFISGAFSAIEQLIVHTLAVKRKLRMA